MIFPFNVIFWVKLVYCLQYYVLFLTGFDTVCVIFFLLSGNFRNLFCGYKTYQEVLIYELNVLINSNFDDFDFFRCEKSGK